MTVSPEMKIAFLGSLFGLLSLVFFIPLWVKAEKQRNKAVNALKELEVDVRVTQDESSRSTFQALVMLNNINTHRSEEL